MNPLNINVECTLSTGHIAVCVPEGIPEIRLIRYLNKSYPPPFPNKTWVINPIARLDTCCYEHTGYKHITLLPSM